jgi:hypothetical protein
MSSITWLDLYSFLCKKANDISNLDQNFWSQKVIVHDAELGDEYECDTWLISNNKGEDKLVLLTNSEKIFT